MSAPCEPQEGKEGSVWKLLTALSGPGAIPTFLSSRMVPDVPHGCLGWAGHGAGLSNCPGCGTGTWQLPERLMDAQQVSGEGAALPVPGPEGAWAVPWGMDPFGNNRAFPGGCSGADVSSAAGRGDRPGREQGLLATPGHSHICCCHRQAGGCGH